MGIFDFFRRKKQPAEAEPAAAAPIAAETAEKMTFDNLDGFIQEGKKKSQEKEHRVIFLIDPLLSAFTADLREKNKILSKIDLKEKKAEERVKIIVLENLGNYSLYLGKLVEQLENIEKKNLEGVVFEINRLFIDFRQKSSISYEKATFLIGDELGSIKERIGIFFKQLNEIFEENKEITAESKLLASVEAKIREIEETKKIKLSIQDNIQSINEKLKDLEKERKLLEDSIENTKSSAEYSQYLKERNDAKSEKKDIEKEILELKNLLNLKELANTWHAEWKQMKIIKEYETDFSQIFDNPQILQLLDENKKARAKQKIEEIKNKTEEIYKTLAKKDALEVFASKIMNVSSEIKRLESEKAKEQKKIEKFDEEIGVIKAGVSEELGKIGVMIA